MTHNLDTCLLNSLGFELFLIKGVFGVPWNQQLNNFLLID